MSSSAANKPYPWYHEKRPDRNCTEGYDYCMVFRGSIDDHSDFCKECYQSLLISELDILGYPSFQHDEIFILVRAPDYVLKRYAEKIKFKMLSDSKNLEKRLRAGQPEERIAPVEILHEKDICKWTPYEHIYLEYKAEHDQGDDSLYCKIKNGTPFTELIRKKLLFFLIRGQKRFGGCNLKISKMLIEQNLKSMFPLHVHDLSGPLSDAMIDPFTWPWQMPFEDIKNYYASKLALYMAFVGHYSKWLIVPSVIGVIFQVVVFVTWDFSSILLPIYSILVSVWSILMLEFWKRKETTIALKWGVGDFEKDERQRPEFSGIKQKSHIDGREEYYNKSSIRVKNICISYIIVVAFMTLVVGVVVGIYTIRFTLQAEHGGSVTSIGASVANTVSITLFNAIYQLIAVELNNMENHRTDTLYEDSLATKLFVFQFINSYSSFFFLAFVAQYMEKPSGSPSNFKGACGASTCMEPLMFNLAIIFGTRLTITNIINLAQPIVLSRMNKSAEMADTDGVERGNRAPTELSEAGQQSVLIAYNNILQNIYNYADTAVQYGFMMLFIPAFPCATALSLLNNYAKIKFDSWKLYKLYQRPSPKPAQDIGSWQSILTIISLISVVTNAGLVSFTMGLLDPYSLFTRMAVFIIFQWALIFIQVIAAFAVDNYPESVRIQLERTDFIVTKIIDKVEDDDYDELMRAIENKRSSAAENDTLLITPQASHDGATKLSRVAPIDYDENI